MGTCGNGFLYCKEDVMDIRKLKLLMLSDLPEDVLRHGVIQLIAQDEQAIPDILEVLNHERKRKKELLTEMNVLMSKADAALDNPKQFNKDNFIQNEVFEFYQKNTDVGHCFRNYKLKDDEKTTL